MSESSDKTIRDQQTRHSLPSSNKRVQHDSQTILDEGTSVEQASSPVPEPEVQQQAETPTPDTESPASSRERYQYDFLLGKGGMGQVFQASDQVMKRKVAIKAMRSDKEITAETKERFCQEACLTGVLEHPNIIPVYDLFAEGTPFFTMRLVQGQTLSGILHTLRHDPGKVAQYSQWKLLHIFISVCYALEFAHSKGVIHRDLKPENIMIGSFGEVWVMDWGLAKQISEHSAESFPSLTSSEHQTQVGAVIGTPRYMSPEQSGGKSQEISFPSDIYSLGVILYEMITLQFAFQGKDLSDTLRQVRRGGLVRVKYNRHHHRIAPELMAIALKATQREPKNRYLAVAQLRQDVENFLKDKPVSVASNQLLQRCNRFIRQHTEASIVLVCSLFLLFILYHIFAWEISHSQLENQLRAQQQQALLEHIDKQKQKPHQLSPPVPLSLPMAFASPVQVRIVGKDLPNELILKKYDQQFQLHEQARIDPQKSVFSLAPGSYLLTVTLPALPNYHFPFYLSGQEKEKVLPLQLPQTTPMGMVYIPGGEYLAGVPGSQATKKKVFPFFIDEHEVSLQQYYRFFQHQPRSEYRPWIEVIQGHKQYLWNDQGQLNLGLTWQHPVFGIPYQAAKAYCQWRSDQQGKPFDLPKAGEWEKAMRGVDGRLYPWGNDPKEEAANVKTFSGSAPLQVVGSFPHDKSVYGVKDLTGNLAEWTQSTDEGQQIIKGGSVQVSLEQAKAYLERPVPSDFRGWIGFRCVCRSVR